MLKFFYLRIMYLYNVSVIVENSESQSVRALLITQLQAAKGDGLTVRLLELLDSPHEGVTYSLQLEALDSEAVASFQSKHVVALQAKTNQHHEGKVYYFDSLMQTIG